MISSPKLQRIEFAIFDKFMADKGIEHILEHRFCAGRRWRMDIAFPKYKIAIEIEGGAFIKGGGRHNRGVGFVKDMEKYNMAASLGWRVFRMTPQQFHKGEWYDWLIRTEMVEQLDEGVM